MARYRRRRYGLCSCAAHHLRLSRQLYSATFRCRVQSLRSSGGITNSRSPTQWTMDNDMVGCEVSERGPKDRKRRCERVNQLSPDWTASPDRMPRSSRLIRPSEGSYPGPKGGVPKGVQKGVKSCFLPGQPGTGKSRKNRFLRTFARFGEIPGTPENTTQSKRCTNICPDWESY